MLMMGRGQRDKMLGLGWKLRWRWWFSSWVGLRVRGQRDKRLGLGWGNDKEKCSSLRRSGYAGSSASASSSHTGLADPKVVDLREQVQNLTQSLQSQGHMLQQQIDEVKTPRDTLAQMA
ncbi:hypothetical protein PIB30_062646 [Stylosanthes scabra]|uniref:t-SNARE coiled-coil homology domain-containing protein n=1 Tax=Stylosanthes scabra TaxID=79078 RepID=A0ABU6XJ38_9FABA|nr:hypothetical protein [Stylosanthes scabra]